MKIWYNKGVEIYRPILYHPTVIRHEYDNTREAYLHCVAKGAIKFTLYICLVGKSHLALRKNLVFPVFILATPKFSKVIY